MARDTFLPKPPLPKRAEYAREQILKAIEKGLFPPGSRLPPERELADLLGVSRASLREALSALQVAGVVEVRHGVGVFVKGLTEVARGLSFPKETWDFLDLTQARYVVERGLVLLSLYEPQPAGLEHMEEALYRMEKAALHQNVVEFLKANILFHQGLANSANNSLLAEISFHLLIKLDQANVRPVRRLFYQADPERMHRAFNVHRGIYLGIREGNRALALESLFRHYADVAASKIAEVAFLGEEKCHEEL